MHCPNFSHWRSVILSVPNGMPICFEQRTLRDSALAFICWGYWSWIHIPMAIKRHVTASCDFIFWIAWGLYARCLPAWFHEAEETLLPLTHLRDLDHMMGGRRGMQVLPLARSFENPLLKANYHLQKLCSLRMIRTPKTPQKSHLLLGEFVNLWGITTQTSDLQQSSASFFYISSLYLFSPIRCNWSCMDWQNPQRNYSRSKRFEYLSRNYFQGVPLLKSVSMIN